MTKARASNALNVKKNAESTNDSKLRLIRSSSCGERDFVAVRGAEKFLRKTSTINSSWLDRCDQRKPGPSRLIAKAQQVTRPRMIICSLGLRLSSRISMILE